MEETLTVEQQQALARARARVRLQETENIPAGRKAPSNLSVAASAPYKAVAGLADMFLNAPENVINSAKMLQGTAANFAGFPEYAPEVTAPPERVSGLLKKAGLIADTEGMTKGQRMLDATLQGLTAAALSPAASLGQFVGGAIKGGAAGAVGQQTTEMTGSPIAGMFASVATPAAITAGAQRGQNALNAYYGPQQQRNALRDATIRQAQNEGYKVLPGNVEPSAKNVVLERIAGKTHLEQMASTKNQEITDKLARRAVGLPENEPISSEAMKRIRGEEFQKGYAPLTQVGPMPTDTAFAQKLDDIAKNYTGAGKSFPSAIPEPVKQIVESFRVSGFDSGDAIQASRALREQASGSFRKGEASLGKAQNEIAKALEDQIERNLASMGNPNAQAMLEQFRESRKRMAITHAVEDAVIEGAGSINAQKLARDLQAGKYLSGDLETIGKFANVEQRVTQPPNKIGTPGAGGLLERGGVGAISAGIGALTGGAPGAVAGALAPELVRAMTRQYLLSNVGQSRVLPSYGSPTLNALAASPYDLMIYNALINVPSLTQQDRQR